MGTQRGQMKGVLSWLVHWACRASARDFCSALAALVGPVQNIFPSPYIILIPLSPSPSKLGRQPCWVACLIVGVSGGDKGIEIVNGEEKKFGTGPTRAAKADKKISCTGTTSPIVIVAYPQTQPETELLLIINVRFLYLGTENESVNATTPK
jgi:hypothetical protein